MHPWLQVEHFFETENMERETAAKQCPSMACLRTGHSTLLKRQSRKIRGDSDRCRFRVRRRSAHSNPLGGVGDARGADKVFRKAWWYQEMEAGPVLSSAAYPQEIS